MIDIEIPYEKDRTKQYRIFEILPGALSWFMLCLPLILSLINVTFAAVFVLAYLLINFARGVSGGLRAIQGLRVVEQHKRLPWQAMLAELEVGTVIDANTDSMVGSRISRTSL